MTELELNELPPPSATRQLRPAPHLTYAARVNRWAIVVGISTYQHERLNLKYADRDAEELYELLQTPSGGGFEAERIVKLVNQYQLGRVLFESERNFTRAVSELNEATELDPNNTRAYFYLGQAIRIMVERETLAKAETALQKYLARGAPLEQEDEVRQFLGSRKASQGGEEHIR